MGKINYGRVILGGIVGGIIAGFIDWFLNGVLMGQLWEDAIKSLNRPNAFSGAFLFCLFLTYSIGGILLVWVYAAIRPRFGAGVRPAVYAGLVAWAFAGLLPNMMNAVTGLYSPRLMLYSTLGMIVELVVGAIAGAALYKEAEPTPAG
ncbi:membrane hypothetical protein [Acidobacteriia bacterium SbA2]|nr:membrane hypothetical protein [Acidobacteriia bacterium SbA2]